METTQRGQARPENCTTCYEVEIALREGKSWQGMLPTRKDHLAGKLASSPWRKKELARQKTELFKTLLIPGQTALHKEAQQEFDQECERIDKEYTCISEEKAKGILEQLTRGFMHEGMDSMIPGDLRFKRSAKGNLFIGAASVLAGLQEAAWRLEDNPGRKRFLRSRLWISPGKLVMYRRDKHGKPVFIQKADGRDERTIPPEAPGPQNMFRGKSSTIIFAERVDAPAYIHFWFWTDPEVEMDMLNRWWPVAGERGIMGYRQMKQGQFDVIKFTLASDSQKQRLLAMETSRRMEAVR